jgi:hypothetical protein
MMTGKLNGLLRACRKRPHSRRSTEQQNELTPSHVGHKDFSHGHMA